MDAALTTFSRQLVSRIGGIWEMLEKAKYVVVVGRSPLHRPRPTPLLPAKIHDLPSPADYGSQSLHQLNQSSLYCNTFEALGNAAGKQLVNAPDRLIRWPRRSAPERLFPLQTEAVLSIDPVADDPLGRAETAVACRCILITCRRCSGRFFTGQPVFIVIWPSVLRLPHFRQERVTSLVTK